MNRWIPCMRTSVRELQFGGDSTTGDAPAVNPAGSLIALTPKRDAAIHMGTVLVGIPSRKQVLHRRENLLGHYLPVTGAPARFILRIGWANGRHRAGVPCDCTGDFST